MSKNRPKVIICMGISGTGKTTIATHLAKVFNLEFIEADNMHSRESIAHMASGKPLTDAMRNPWVETICNHLNNLGHNAVLSFSGLRRAHRESVRSTRPDILFIKLSGSKHVITNRMKSRDNHFMPVSLLESQITAMEPILNEPDIMVVNIDCDLEDIQKLTEVIARDFLKQN